MTFLPDWKEFPQTQLSNILNFSMKIFGYNCCPIYLQGAVTADLPPACSEPALPVPGPSGATLASPPPRTSSRCSPAPARARGGGGAAATSWGQGDARWSLKLDVVYRSSFRPEASCRRDRPSLLGAGVRLLLLFPESAEEKEAGAAGSG